MAGSGIWEISGGELASMDRSKLGYHPQHSWTNPSSATTSLGLSSSSRDERTNSAPAADRAANLSAMTRTGEPRLPPWNSRQRSLERSGCACASTAAISPTATGRTSSSRTTRSEKRGREADPPGAKATAEPPHYQPPSISGMTARAPRSPISKWPSGLPAASVISHAAPGRVSWRRRFPGRISP